MPQLASAAKRLRQSEKRRAYNQRTKNAIEKSMKLVTKNGITDMDLWKKYVSQVDRATQKGVLKKNTAARRKSRLWKKLSTAKKTK